MLEGPIHNKIPSRKAIDALRNLLKQSARLRADVGTGYEKAGAALFQQVSERIDDLIYAAQIREVGSRNYIVGQAEFAKNLLGRLVGVVSTGEGAAPDDPEELRREAAETLDATAEEFAS